MTSRLKQILLKMVRLSSADQRWILRQLADEQLATFKRLNGLEILENAKRFRKMDIKNLAIPKDESKPLPDYCTQLATKTPLYTAIILEQGCYPWQASFLKKFDSEKQIADMLETRVPDIKEAVKQTLHDEWERTVSLDIETPSSFEHYLENTHG